VVAAATAAAAAVALSLLIRRLVLERSSSHARGTVAREIEDHIRTTQVPGRALGIRVAGLDESSLSLSAPLTRNKNVHGTAFAGSLYAVGVLSAYCAMPRTSRTLLLHAASNACCSRLALLVHRSRPRVDAPRRSLHVHTGRQGWPY
jgi:hypothetical protein